MQERPSVFVLGGPNGAGKSTVADILIPDSVRSGSYVIADVIAAELAPEDPGSVAFEAGRRMLHRIRRFRDEPRTFGFEATLTSKSVAPFLVGAQCRGLVVVLSYVGLPSPQLAVDRVKIRASSGGHDVPEATVRRRYERSLTNFFRLYRPLADEWTLWDNTEEHLSQIAGASDGQMTITDFVRWRTLKRRAEKA